MPSKRPGGRAAGLLSAWPFLSRGVKKFRQIGGTHWGAAFAYRAFFALLPLLLLVVTIASTFVERSQAGPVVAAYIERYLPLTPGLQQGITDSVGEAIRIRGRADVLAFLVWLWFTLRCLGTLFRAGNLALGGPRFHWWGLQLKCLAFLGVAIFFVFIGFLGPAMNKWLIPPGTLSPWLLRLASFSIAVLLVFLGLVAFYRLIPGGKMRPARAAAAALAATLLLLLAESLFIVYLKHFAVLNPVYGVPGALMALLLWIYLSGCIVILGACIGGARGKP